MSPKTQPTELFNDKKEKCSINLDKQNRRKLKRLSCNILLVGETIYFLVPYNPRQVMEKVSTHCGYKAKIQGNYCFPLPPKTQATVLLYCFPLSPKTQTTTLFSNNEKKRNPLAKHSSTFAGKETPTTKAPEKISGHSRAGYNRTVVSSNLTNI